MYFKYKIFVLPLTIRFLILPALHLKTISISMVLSVALTYFSISAIRSKQDRQFRDIFGVSVGTIDTIWDQLMWGNSFEGSRNPFFWA